MLKKSLIAALLLAATASANAELVGGVSYSRISDDDAGVDIDLGALGGTLGYVVNPGSSFLFIPEFRIGFGVSDDSVALLGIPVTADLKTYYGVSFRGQFEASDNLYVYFVPSYINYDIEASGGGVTVSEDSWEFGIGAGVGFNFTESVGAELSYETVDGTDVISVGLRFGF